MLRLGIKGKLAKLLLAVLVLVLLLLTASWYLVTYRFRETLRYIVETESDGTYVLQTRSAKFSFWEKTVKVKDAHLLPTDSLAHETHYDVKIPSIFFSITSWTQILFEARVTVDSFSIDFPEISIYDRSKDKPGKTKITVHASDVFDKLQDVKSYLSVRSFTLNNAAFSFATHRQPGRFHSNKINFSVKNFAGSDSAQRFLTSENVLLDIADQDWNFPDNRHRVQFKQLLLSGEEKVFRIDSCVFSGLDRHDREFSISVSSILFSTESLSALYDRGELVIDSLLLRRPEVTIPTTEKTFQQSDDAGHVISDAIREMFSGIQVKYIHIDSGMLFLANGNDVQPVSRDRTDIKIYNLVVSEGENPISTDSIILSQQKIAFTTRDNLFRLNIERFLLKDNSLFLSGVMFGPTPENKASRVFTFRAPSMTLKNIDLEDLIEKRINAGIAELINPEINFVDRGKGKERVIAGKGSTTESFFTTLRGLDELLDVDSFRIRNGNVSYRTFGDEATYVKLEDIDMYVRLNEFAASDDIGDIEKSISHFSTKKIILYTPGLSVNAEGFQMAGKLRKAQVAAFNIHSTQTHTIGIAGSGLEWTGVDWSSLFNRHIKLHTLHLKTIDLQMSPGTGEAGAARDTLASLPLEIRHIRVDVASFKSDLETAIRFRAEKLQADNIRAADNSLQWAKALVVVHSFELENSKTRVSAQQVVLNTDAHSQIRNLLFSQQAPGTVLHAALPSVIVAAPLRSAVSGNWHITSMALDRPVVSYRRTEQISGDTAFSGLPGIRMDRLTVTGASIEYKDDVKELTTTLDLTLDAADITTVTDLLTLRSVDINIDSLKAGSEKWRADLPLFTSNIRDIRWQLQGKKALTCTISSRWSRGQFNRLTDSSRLNIADIEGEMINAGLEIIDGSVNIHSLLEKVSFHTGPVGYEGREIGAQTEFVHWQPAERKLQAGPFHIKPLLEEKAYFEKSGWQSDYVTVSGRAIEIAGLTYGVKAPKAVAAAAMALEDVLITTFRDKTLPIHPEVFKPMFGQMLKKVTTPVAIDSVKLDNAKVLVDILSAFTGKRASIPIDNLNATLTGLRNFNNNSDSFCITGSLRLYNTHAHHIVYKEAYNDSLYGFSLRLNASPMTLPELTDITLPFANVVVESGYADTLYAQWNGNKYAAVGKMNFYYDGLKVKMVKSTDTARSGLFRRLASLFTNDVLIHRKNQQPSYIFYIRDTRKSVFNYWVKSLLSGALSSSVIFQEKKLRKKYNRHKDDMRLPEMDF